NEHKNAIEEEQIPVVRILENIEDLRGSLESNEDAKQQLVIENLMLLTLLGQLRSEGAELESEKKILEQGFKIMTERCTMLQKDKHELLEVNRQLGLDVRNGKQQEEVLKAQLETQRMDLLSLQDSYRALQEENLKMLGENRSLLQKFSDLKEEMHI